MEDNCHLIKKPCGNEVCDRYNSNGNQKGYDLTTAKDATPFTSLTLNNINLAAVATHTLGVLNCFPRR